MIKHIAMVAVVVAYACPAMAGDWKFYGGASVRGEQQYCFLDLESISFQAVAHPRVWTECFRASETENFSADDADIKRAADLVAKKYVPPVARYTTMESDQIISAILDEQIANANRLEPAARLF
jgi:hypothetical protein